MNALDATLRFNEQALKLGAARQQVIASNIANADTPQWKASDLDFAKALERANAAPQGNGATALAASLSASTPRAGHFALAATSGANVWSSADLAPRVPTQGAIDGNGVDMDVERAAFAENTVRYQASFSFLNHQIKTLLTAIQG